ncbi:hypothetical protein K502DRAFT_365335 [Neoconidiobolus thromboides FSU 785]|nr:hypothetical protein K502DRAFT_365335 [Neoconidiobolus thromboides FSU 785]
MNNKILLSRIFNFVSGIIALSINGFIKVVPIKGNNPNQLMPSPIAFSIWGIIYLFKLSFMIYQLLPRTYTLKYINKGITPYFSILALLNITWLITQSQFRGAYYFIQLIVIYLMFLILFFMYTTTFKYIKNDLIMKIESNDNFYLNYWFGRVWLSMYFAWITGAICVDSFSVFSSFSSTNYISSSLTLCLLTIITMFVLHINRDVVFSLTFIWFTSWVLINNKDIEGSYPLFITSIIAIGIISIASIMTLILNIQFVINRNRGIEMNTENENFQRLFNYFKRSSNYNSLD